MESEYIKNFNKLKTTITNCDNFSNFQKYFYISLAYCKMMDKIEGKERTW